MKKNKFMLASILLIGALSLIGCADPSNTNSNNEKVPEVLKMSVEAKVNTETKELTKFYFQGSKDEIIGKCTLNNGDARIVADFTIGDQTLKVTEAPLPDDYKLIIKENGFSDNCNLDNAKMYILNPDTPATNVTVEITLDRGLTTKITGAKYILMPSILGADKGYDLFGDYLLLLGGYEDKNNVETPEVNLDVPSKYKKYTEINMFKDIGTITNIYDNTSNEICLLFEYSEIKKPIYDNIINKCNHLNGLLKCEHTIKIVNPNYKYIEFSILERENACNLYTIRLGENINSPSSLNGNMRMNYSGMTLEELKTVLGK